MSIEKDRERYLRALHAMQSGVAMEMGLPERQKATEPKHLRTWINVAMCDHAALVKVLVAKGIITDAEYFAALADQVEEEVRRYEQRLSEATGSRITLL